LVRADISRAPADLPAAVGHLREAAPLLPDGHPDHASVDARLGVALAAWVQADLATEATAGTTTGGTGDAATERAAAGGGQPGERLSEAIDLLAKASRGMPPGDPFLIRVRSTLATASATRFMRYAGSEADRQVALSGFEAILRVPALDDATADLCHIYSACLILFGTA